MPNQPFVGGIDILPGNQGPPVPANAFRLVTIGGAPYYTTDGVNFNALASAALATPSAAGLMSAAQAASLAPMPAGSFPAISLTSGIIDFTATGVFVIGLPVAARLVAVVSTSIEAKTVGGTRSTAPTFSIGTNSPNFDNIFASETQPAGILTAAAETATAFFTGLTTNCPDMTTSGVKINITSGLSGAGAVFTGVISMLIKTAPV